MMPLRVSSEGALHVRVRVRESTGVAWMPRGTSLGTAHIQQNYEKKLIILYTFIIIFVHSYTKITDHLVA
jgi:hypothetical protein